MACFNKNFNIVELIVEQLEIPNLNFQIKNVKFIYCLYMLIKYRQNSKRKISQRICRQPILYSNSERYYQVFY